MIVNIVKVKDGSNFPKNYMENIELEKALEILSEIQEEYLDAKPYSEEEKALERISINQDTIISVDTTTYYIVVTNETVYRLMNHDSSHEKPRFEKFTLLELNEQFETSYKSVEEAIEADPEYLFDYDQMIEYLK